MLVTTHTYNQFNNGCRNRCIFTARDKFLTRNENQREKKQQQQKQRKKKTIATTKHLNKQKLRSFVRTICLVEYITFSASLRYT